MSQSNRRGRTTHRQSDGGMYRGAGAYPKDLVPAARTGDYVRLEPAGDVYQVDIVTPQPGVLAFNSDDSNDVTISANGEESDNEAEDLELPEGWLGQYRLIHPGADLTDGVRVTVDLGGTQAPLYTNKRATGEIVEETATEIGDDGSGTSVSGDSFNQHLTEMYVHEDEVPFFTFNNTTGSQVTVSDLRFAGFQYRLTPSSAPSGQHVEPLPTQRVRGQQ